MTVYETTSHHQIRMWSEASDLWPGCMPGQSPRTDARQLEFIYDPNKGWCDLQSRNVRPD